LILERALEQERPLGVLSTHFVLGKYSGCDALGFCCEELSFRLDRHELDQMYRHFLALPDSTTIEGSQILSLIRKIPLERSPASVTAESPDAFIFSSSNPGGLPDSGSASVGLSQGGAPGAAKTSVVLGVHESEQQEDYLWGV
jgi:hypothetical protein